MKKNIFRFPILSAATLTLLLSMGVTSCDRDKLEPEPVTFFSDAAVFSDPSRIEAQARGLYAAAKSGQYLGGRYFVYQDIRGEEFINRTGNGVTGLSTWNFTLTEGANEVNNLWNAIYYTINSANIFAEGVEDNRAVLNNDALVNNYIGEARFLRAIGYFQLLSLYARPYNENNGSSPGIPLRLTGNKGAAGNDLVRSSVADVYAQILTDLNFAEANLPESYSSGHLNATRAHRNAAIALKVRVLLHQSRYQDAISEANKIVSATAPFSASSGIAHALEANVLDAFKAPFESTERILSMPFTSNNLPGTQNGLGHYYNPGPRGGGEYYFNDAGIINHPAFDSTDARRAWLFRNAADGFDYLNKYPLGPEHLDYGPVLRYAEVLLNLAEAEARVNGVSPRAVALLNAVRGRSNPNGTYSTGDFANAGALIDAILTERRLELVGEGFRSLDLMRTGQTIPGKGGVQAIPPSENAYIWPIPSGELATNKLCERNP